MLIESGEKLDLIPHQTTVARDNVGQHFFVGMAEVRRAICVVDCGGDIGLLAHRHRCVGENRPAVQIY